MKTFTKKIPIIVIALLLIIIALILFLFVKNDYYSNLHSSYTRCNKTIEKIDKDLKITDIYVSDENEQRCYFILSKNNKIHAIYGEEGIDDIFLVSDDYYTYGEYVYIDYYDIYMDRSGLSDCMDYLEEHSDINKLSSFSVFKVKL